MKCALCGHVFSEDDAKCRGCSVNRNCSTVCCPNCGYRTVEKSGILDWIKKRFKGDDNHVSDK